MSAGAEIIPIKVLDQNGTGSWAQLIQALDLVEKFGQKGDVVLMSLGAEVLANCENSDPVLKEIILDLGTKGLFVVMSSGNIDEEWTSEQSSQNFPGCINGPKLRILQNLYAFLTRLTRKKAFSPRNQVEFAIKALCHIRSIFDVINTCHSFFQKIKGLAGLADGL